MAAHDAARWDARYADLDDDVTPMPPDAIADLEHSSLVPTTGTALDVACGRGAQTIWMAQRGLHVVAIDTSPVAITSLREQAASFAQPRDAHDADSEAITQRIDARVHDLDDGLPDDVTELDVIVCQRFRDPSLYAQFVDRLRPGGLLIVTVLSETGATDAGPFHAPFGELRSAFTRNDCTIVHHEERDGQESVVARRNYPHAS